MYIKFHVELTTVSFLIFISRPVLHDLRFKNSVLIVTYMGFVFRTVLYNLKIEITFFGLLSFTMLHAFYIFRLTYGKAPNVRKSGLIFIKYFSIFPIILDTKL